MERIVSISSMTTVFSLYSLFIEIIIIIIMMLIEIVIPHLISWDISESEIKSEIFQAYVAYLKLNIFGFQKPTFQALYSSQSTSQTMPG